MIEMKVQTRMDVQKVLRKAKKANIESLGHAGATIRLTARRSIRRDQKPSAVGRPPHTRRGLLRRAIVYAVDKYRQMAVIGPAYGMVGQSATAHEFGGRYRRQHYKKRRFMGPALEKTKNRLPRHWAGSVR